MPPKRAVLPKKAPVAKPKGRQLKLQEPADPNIRFARTEFCKDLLAKKDTDEKFILTYEGRIQAGGPPRYVLCRADDPPPVINLNDYSSEIFRLCFTLGMTNEGKLLFHIHDTNKKVTSHARKQIFLHKIVKNDPDYVVTPDPPKTSKRKRASDASTKPRGRPRKSLEDTSATDGTHEEEEEEEEEVKDTYFITNDSDIEEAKDGYVIVPQEKGSEDSHGYTIIPFPPSSSDLNTLKRAVEKLKDCARRYDIWSEEELREQLEKAFVTFEEYFNAKEYLEPLWEKMDKCVEVKGYNVNK